jgi:hypothetical protein
MTDTTTSGDGTTTEAVAEAARHLRRTDANRWAYRAPFILGAFVAALLLALAFVAGRASAQEPPGSAALVASVTSLDADSAAAADKALERADQTALALRLATAEIPKAQERGRLQGHHEAVECVMAALMARNLRTGQAQMEEWAHDRASALVTPPGAKRDERGRHAEGEHRELMDAVGACGKG